MAEGGSGSLASWLRGLTVDAQDEYPELTAAKAARERDALARAGMAVRGEMARLAPVLEDREAEVGTPTASAGALSSFVIPTQTPEQVVHGYAPGYGPELEAQRIESLAGRYEAVPGWWNAGQFAEAGAEAARSRADGVLAGLARKGRPYNQPLHRDVYDEEFRRNRHLLSPQQFSYMQEVGRTVDLLRNLRNPEYADGPMGSAATAVHYWDKSNPVHNPGAIRAREDFNDPNYQRFAGAGNATQAFFTNPDSPLVKYFQAQQVVPNSIRHAWESPAAPAGDSFQRAANTRSFARRNMLNAENPVLSVPTPSDPTDSEAWTAALGRAAQDSTNLQPPPWQNIANSGWRGLQHAAQKAAGIERPVVANATAAAGDLLGLLGDAVDASVGSSFLVGIPARVRGLGALARSLGRPTPSVATRLVPAVAGQAWQEGVPEVALGGTLNTMAGDPGRTFVDYLTAPAADVPLDAAARTEAQRQEEARSLAGQQSIPEERRKAYYRHMPGGR